MTNKASATILLFSMAHALEDQEIQLTFPLTDDLVHPLHYLTYNV